MARTFNRNPLQVPAPSSGDVKNYFFNHFNWKGVDRNKNFLSVDQETFADAKNVCVDNEGVLRSRPAIKSVKNSFNNILNFWKFDDVEVYLRKDGDILRLQFFKDGTMAEDRPMYENVQLTYVDRKIFIFGGSKMLTYYDVDDLVVKDDLRIYVPNTTFDANGVETEIEDANVLTDNQLFTYLYNSTLGASASAYGKNVYTIIDGKRYDFTFTDKNILAFAVPKFDVNSSYRKDDVLLLAVSNNNSYALYSHESRLLAYSVNGKVFDRLIEFDESFGTVIGKPKFSHDGNYIAMATDKGLYIVSVVADTSTGELRYPNFVSLCDYHNLSDVVFNVEFDLETYDDYACAFTIYSNIWGDTENSPALYGTYVRICNKGVCNTITLPDQYNDFDNVCIDISYSSAYRCVRYNSDVFQGAAFLSVVNKDNTKTTFYGFSSDFAYDFIYEFTLPIEDDIDTSPYTYDSKVTAGFITWVVGYAGFYQYFIVDQSFILTPEYTEALQQIHEEIGNPAYISRDGSKILTDKGIYFISNNSFTEIIVKDSERIYPQAFTDYIYYTFKRDSNALYSSYFEDSINLYRHKGGKYDIPLPTHIAALNEQFIAVKNKLYITETREDDGGYLWYIPERNKHVFKSDIHKLCPISTTEMGVFLEDEIWIVARTELGYQVIKSKLSIGLKNGSDVLTSYDGSKTIFCSDRGLVALSYQDFVASTDQVLITLSDPIYDEMVEFVKQPTKLFMTDFWLILYGNGIKFYIFDLRNNSWWPCEYNKPISKIIKLDDMTILCDSKLYKFDFGHALYSDDGNPIDWYVTSQKLHLNATNYYKHVVNLTLSSVIEVNSDEPLTYDMDIINYRDSKDVGKSQTLEYKVQSIRTFVQRLNHFKVNEFQYTLRTDHDNKIQLPLSISDITVKYKIQGQVR